MKRLDKAEAKAILAARYDAWIGWIKRWLLICALVSPTAFVLWMVVTPHLPTQVRAGVSIISALASALATYVVVTSLILWPIFANEKKQRLREIETRFPEQHDARD